MFLALTGAALNLTELSVADSLFAVLITYSLISIFSVCLSEALKVDISLGGGDIKLLSGMGALVGLGGILDIVIIACVGSLSIESVLLNFKPKAATANTGIN